MTRLACFIVLAACAATSAMAQPAAFPDLRGTWKGDSESIVLTRGNAHHPGGKAAAPRMTSVPFTLVIDKQEGRRFSGTFSSPRHSETVIAVISRNGAIYMVDDDGYNIGTMLTPARMELCYMKGGQAGRIASCTEMTRQP
jgi:hypothetical protein